MAARPENPLEHIGAQRASASRELPRLAVVTHRLAALGWRWSSQAAPIYDACVHSHHMLHLSVWLPVIIVVAILILAFEIWMIVDAALNKEVTDKAKTWWIIGMFVIHPFVAIAYFFTDHRKR